AHQYLPGRKGSWRWRARRSFPDTGKNPKKPNTLSQTDVYVAGTQRSSTTTVGYIWLIVSKIRLTYRGTKCGPEKSKTFSINIPRFWKQPSSVSWTTIKARPWPPTYPSNKASMQHPRISLPSYATGWPHTKHPKRYTSSTIYQKHPPEKSAATCSETGKPIRD